MHNIQNCIEDFQFYIGFFVFLLAIGCLLNTVFRFTEISQADREEFSNEQNKAREDKREQNV